MSSLRRGQQVGAANARRTIIHVRNNWTNFYVAGVFRNKKSRTCMTRGWRNAAL